MNALNKIPVLGFCAHSSGIGKTTLLTQLIPALISKGLRISVIKHAHHDFDIDHEGKDSYRLRQAGAVQMMIGSKKRWALMTELALLASEDNNIIAIATDSPLPISIPQIDLNDIHAIAAFINTWLKNEH